MKRLEGSDGDGPRLLFLGYGPEDTPLPRALMAAGAAVWHEDGPLAAGAPFDLVVSFGYRHILRRHHLDALGGPVINLHIALLPWNRGAHPNFWAHYDATPHGVSIHLIDEGVDTGDILFQRQVAFSERETTFAATHRRLVAEIEDLFFANVGRILAQDWTPRPQRGAGSVHRLADLPADFGGWDCEIGPEIARLRGAG